MVSPIKGKEAIKILQRGIQTPCGKVLKLVDPLTLKVDSTYQRGLIPSAVDRIRRNFDEKALGIFQCAQREYTGDLFVTDAQHRLAAIKQRANDREEIPDAVLALIEPNTTLAQEAKMFVDCNTNKPVTGNNRFRARLVQTGAQPEQTINKWVIEEGFELAFLNAGRPSELNVSSNGIYSVTSLLDAYNKCPNHLKPALRLLKDVWGNGNPKMVPYPCRSGQVVYAIADFLTSQGDKIGTGLSKRLKSMNVDLAAVWAEAKREAGGCGYARHTILVKRLQQFANGK